MVMFSIQLSKFKQGKKGFVAIFVSLFWKRCEKESAYKKFLTIFGDIINGSW